jgi:hypothetical protein
MKTIKPYLFTLLCLFFTSTMFLSCSNENFEENDLNANQIKEETQVIQNPKEVIPAKPYSLEENVNKFSVSYLNNSNKIAAIFKENKEVFNNSSLKFKISACKSENELFTVIKNSNIDNSTALISLLKKQNKLCVNFALQNKSFAELTQKQKAKLLLDAFLANGIYQKKNRTTSKTAQGDCDIDYQNDMGEVVVDHIYNLAQILGLAAATVYYSGGTLTPEVAVVTLVAVGIEEIYFNYNVGNAIDKYEQCLQRNCGQKRQLIKY